MLDLDRAGEEREGQAGVADGDAPGPGQHIGDLEEGLFDVDGLSERAFCSKRRETPPASNVSRAGLTPRTSFQNDPSGLEPGHGRVSFWNASSQPISSPSTATRKGKTE